MTILRGAKPEWTVTDRVLAVAHVMAGDMLCPGCGQPKHESYNPDSEGHYVVKDYTCQGCAAVERDAKEREKQDHARKIHIVDERPRDEPLRPWSP